MPEHTAPADLDWTRAAPEDATGPGPWIEIAFGPDDHVYLRETSDPANIVTTTRRKWDAFVLGVQAGEFDHFVEGREDREDLQDLEDLQEPEASGEAGGSGDATRPERAGRAEETQSAADTKRAGR